MLNIVCVKWGTLYNADYVNKLYDMVRRNIKDGFPGKFICFTEDPAGLHKDIETRQLPRNLVGWWNKLYLFKQGLFPDGDRVLYLDLDTVIVSSLDEIITYNGAFAILRDFYRPNGYGSAIMAWEANTLSQIWEHYVLAHYPAIEGGDQAWIEEIYSNADIWQDLYVNSFVSYKEHCKEGIPKNAKVICFHGNPRPHEVLTGWIPQIWKVGGGSSLELVVEGNTKLNVIKDNIRYALNSGLDIISDLEIAHDREAIIVGGGPSISDFIYEITKKAYNQNVDVIALNNSWRWLHQNDIAVNAHIMLDARPENINFLPHCHTIRGYYATQCHPSIIDACADRTNFVHLWHANISEIADDFSDKNMFWIGSGTSVGIRSILLLYVLGYRKFSLYGYDSSYVDSEGHAYKQKINDGEKTIEVIAGDRKFTTAPWMVTQTEEFLQVMEHLTKQGCEFSIHGDGLLQHCAKTMLIPVDVGSQQGNITEYGGVFWPTNDNTGRGYITAVMNDIDQIMNHVKGRKVCVQAGGNVGLWPKEFAKHFDAVYTIEPDNINFQCLVRNCIELNIIKIQAVFGYDRNCVNIEQNTQNCGAHSVGKSGIVPTIRIDDLGLSECDLIQLDVEGYELNALMGAVTTITSFCPVIVVEENGLSKKYNTQDGDIAKFLSGFSYKEAARYHRDIVFIYNE